MAFRDDLAGHVDRSTALIEESPQMDEQNTKRKIIEPLLDHLGWDLLTSDVELEYSVQMGSGTKKVDYALKLEETPVVFFEAKGCDTTLTEDHQNQLTSYMRQVGVDWGLLSNGREFRIFRRDQSSSRPNEISLASFPIEDVGQNIHPLKALTKESIETGESRQIAEKIESIQNAVASLHDNKEGIAEEISRVVTKEIGESVSQHVEDEAKDFVDSLISSLEDQAHKAEIQPKDTPQQPVTESGLVIRLLDDGDEVNRFSEKNQAKTIASLVVYLIQEEDLINAIDIPYIPGTGRGSRAFLNDEPKHANGDEMRMYEELPGGLYLFTALSAKDKERYVSELSETVGMECEFTGNW